MREERFEIKQETDVRTNESGFVQSTKLKLANMLKEIRAIPDNLRKYAESVRLNSDTAKAALLSAVIFMSGSGIAYASDNRQAILDQAIK